MPEEATAVPSRVCIVLLTGLGDVVMGLPIANALKAANPAVHVTWVVEPMPAPILEAQPAIDEIVVYRKAQGWRGVRALWRQMAPRRFDLTLNLNVYFKSVWPTLFSRAPRRLGFGRERARDGVWLAATERLRAGPRRHTLDMFLEFLDPLGARPAAPEWRLGFTAAERQAQERFFAPLRERPVVALVPASAIAAKDWLPERYAEVADALEHDFGYRTLLVGGPGEREQRLAREIAERSRARPVWAMGEGIRRLAWTLGGSDLVISPDTGPVHLARALEVPVIGLYGHTNPWRVGPYRQYEDLWIDRYTDPGQAPDPSSFEPHRGRMQQITARDVLEKVELARARYLAPPHRVG